MRKRRETLELSQTEFARRLNQRQHLPFHQQTVQRIEAGERPIRLDEAFKIAAELGLRVEAMIQAATVRSDLVYSVNKLQRETEQFEGWLRETMGDWFEAYEELTAAFYELLEENSDKATREVRWTAAWLIKAKWVAETVEQLAEMTNGITTTREDWHDVVVRSDGAPEWLDEEHADVWKGLAESDNPVYLADLAPGALTDYLLQDERRG